jgi:hypothetical protein
MEARRHESQILTIMIASLILSAAILPIKSFGSSLVAIQTLGMGHNLLAVLFIFSEPNAFKTNFLNLLLGLFLFALLVICFHISVQIAIWAVMVRVVYGFTHILKDELHFLSYSNVLKTRIAKLFLASIFVAVSSAIVLKTVGYHLNSDPLRDLGGVAFYVAAAVSLVSLGFAYFKVRGKQTLVQKLYIFYFVGLLLTIGILNATPFLNVYLISFALVHHIVSWYFIYLHRVYQRRGRIDEVKGPIWLRHIKTQPLLFILLVVGINGLYFWGEQVSIASGWLQPSRMILGESLARSSWTANGQPYFFLIFDVLAYHALGIIHNTLSWRVWLRPVAISS